MDAKNKSSEASSTIANHLLDLMFGFMKEIRAQLREESQEELSIPQHRILAHINSGWTTAVDLANLQGVSFPAIWKLIDTLEERGYLAKAYRDGNKKQIFLSLTKKGKERYEKSRGAVRERLGTIVDKLEKAHRQDLKKGLEAMDVFLKAIREPV